MKNLADYIYLHALYQWHIIVCDKLTKRDLVDWFVANGKAPSSRALF